MDQAPRRVTARLGDPARRSKVSYETKALRDKQR